jgi:ankyrin repeat protein
MPVDTRTLDVAANVLKGKDWPSELRIEKPEDLRLALQIALLERQSIEQIDSLLDRGFDLNTGEESLLFFALEQPPMIRHLVARGADVNYANPFGKTPLFYAIDMNDHKLMALLLKLGADAKHAYASTSPQVDQFDCRYNITHTNRTVLMHAAQHADVKMIKMLLKAGAPLAAFDGMGYTATDYALEASRQSNAEYLKKLGLQSKVVEDRQRRAACSRKALAAKLRSTAYREFVAECLRTA